MSDSPDHELSGISAELSPLQEKYWLAAENSLSEIRDQFKDETGQPRLKKIETDNFVVMLALIERFAYPDGPEEVRREFKKVRVEYEALLTTRFAKLNNHVANRKEAMDKNREDMIRWRDLRHKTTPRLPGDEKLDSLSELVLKATDPAKKLLDEATNRRDLTKHLRRTGRHETMVRMSWLVAEAIASFLVFALGFDWLKEELNGGAPWLIRHLAVVGRTVPEHYIAFAISFIATITFFVLERWLLSPLIESWIARRIRDEYMIAASAYFVRRIELEYILAMLEHELTKPIGSESELAQPLSGDPRK